MKRAAEQLGTSLAVVASNSIVGDVVAAIGTEKIHLDLLAKPGQNPHSFEPGPQDILALERADLVFINGFGLEEEVLPFLEGLDDVHSLSEGITPLHGHEAHEDHAEEDDPHVWFNPANVIIWAENISMALSGADPANAAFYSENARRYTQELKELDAEIRLRVDAVPQNRRRLISDHNVLAYFAEEYGFDIVDSLLPNLNDQAEPSPRHIAELAEILKAQEAELIVVGETAGQGLRNLARALAAETGEEVKIVSILSGSLARAGSPGDSYISFMRTNVEAIIAGLE